MLINLINSVIAKKVLNSSVYLKPFAMKTVVCFIISVLFKLKFQGTIKKRFVIAVIRHTLIANLYIIFWRIRYKIISGQCIKLSLVIKLILPSFRKKNITFLLIWSVTLFKKACHVPGCSECRATTGLLKTILSVSTGILCKQSFLVRKYLLKIHLCIVKNSRFMFGSAFL